MSQFQRAAIFASYVQGETTSSTAIIKGFVSMMGGSHEALATIPKDAYERPGYLTHSAKDNTYAFTRMQPGGEDVFSVSGHQVPLRDWAMAAMDVIGLINSLSRSFTVLLLLPTRPFEATSSRTFTMLECFNYSLTVSKSPGVTFFFHDIENPNAKDRSTILSNKEFVNTLFEHAVNFIHKDDANSLVKKPVPANYPIGIRYHDVRSWVKLSQVDELLEVLSKNDATHCFTYVPNDAPCNGQCFPAKRVILFPTTGRMVVNLPEKKQFIIEQIKVGDLIAFGSLAVVYVGQVDGEMMFAAV